MTHGKFIGISPAEGSMQPNGVHWWWAVQARRTLNAGYNITQSQLDSQGSWHLVLSRKVTI